MGSPQDSFDPFEMLEKVDPVVSALAGIKKKFVDAGFSDEFAETMTMKIMGAGIDAASLEHKRGTR